MRLDTFQRRRAGAVLVVVAIVVLVCLATGNAVAAAVVVALTPALVYRVTGHGWSDALSWAFGREPGPMPGREPVPAPGLPPRSDRRPPPRPQQRVAGIAMLVAIVPAALGLLSVMAGKVVGAEDSALPIGIVMTLAWTGFAALLSGLVVQEGRRAAIALAAGAATVVSVLVWAGLVF